MIPVHRPGLSGALAGEEHFPSLLLINAVDHLHQPCAVRVDHLLGEQIRLHHSPVVKVGERDTGFGIAVAVFPDSLQSSLLDRSIPAYVQ